MHSPSHITESSWHILGIGALGGLWAMRLAMQTHTPRLDVRLLLRDDRVKHQTLTLRDGTARHSHDFVAETADQAFGPIEHLLVATKSYDTLAALEALRPRLNSDSRIYLMQNGLGSQHAVAQAFPDLAILAVTTTEGAYRQARFDITHAGRGTTWVGAFNERAQRAHAEDAAAVFNRAGFATQATADINAKLWLKLAINCAINPFTAVLDCPNGELPRQEFFQHRIAPLCEEIASAMATTGLPVTATELQTQVATVIQGTAQNISSMLQDVRAGRRTEIDAINGYLVSVCDQQDLPCPINRELVQLVKARDPV